MLEVAVSTLTRDPPHCAGLWGHVVSLYARLASINATSSEICLQDLWKMECEVLGQFMDGAVQDFAQPGDIVRVIAIWSANENLRISWLQTIDDTEALDALTDSQVLAKLGEIIEANLRRIW